MNWRDTASGLGAMLCLSILFAAAPGCGGEGGVDPPDPTPTPQAVARTKLQVLRDGGTTRLSLTVDGVGGPVFLVGQRALLGYGTEGQISKIDPTTCQVTQRWTNVQSYLDAAKANGLNFVQVELWNDYEPDSPFPFQTVGTGGTRKYRVQAAVENGEWNQAYFQALRSFVNAASGRGIAVQVTLFNHYNLRSPLAWRLEPMRAANTDTNFGIPDHNGQDRLRTRDFVHNTDGSGNLTRIGRIQKALIERVVEELVQENIIIEPVMVPWMINNPNIGPLDLPRWENWVIATIRAKEQALGRASRAPISVTPAPMTRIVPVIDGGVNKDFDIAHWKAAASQPGLENWSQVDMITYAGGFAFNEPALGTNAAIYARERMINHRRLFPDKMALYNTDGFNQRYAPNRCDAALGEYVRDLRHGWWEGRSGDVDLSLYPLLWARETRLQIDTQRTPLGSVHFLNWTTALSSMEDLKKGNF